MSRPGAFLPCRRSTGRVERGRKRQLHLFGGNSLVRAAVRIRTHYGTGSSSERPALFDGKDLDLVAAEDDAIADSLPIRARGTGET